MGFGGVRGAAVGAHVHAAAVGLRLIREAVVIQRVAGVHAGAVPVLVRDPFAVGFGRRERAPASAERFEAVIVLRRIGESRVAAEAARVGLRPALLPHVLLPVLERAEDCRRSANVHARGTAAVRQPEIVGVEVAIKLVVDAFIAGPAIFGRQNVAVGLDREGSAVDRDCRAFADDHGVVAENHGVVGLGSGRLDQREAVLDAGHQVSGYRVRPFKRVGVLRLHGDRCAAVVKEAAFNYFRLAAGERIDD